MKKCLLFILTFIVSVGSSWATFVPKVSNDQFRYYYSFTVQSSRWYKVLYDKQDGKFTADGSNSKSAIKAHFRFEQGTEEGRYYLASRLTGKYWYVESNTNDASITLIDDKRSATEWVVVDLGGSMSLKPADATENLCMYHNGFDNVDNSLMNFILSNKTNDSNAKWAAELQCQEIQDFTTSDGDGNYTVGATGDSFSTSSQMNENIQSGNVTFTGSGDNGVAIDMNNNDVPISGHLVFKNGIHTFRKINVSGKNIKFGTNATAENPTIYIKEGARLTATLKDPCGWQHTADVDGIIRIDDTSMLEIIPEGSNTAYYSQRLYMEPGAQIVINSTGGDQFRMNGGVNEATAQLYMPASSEGSAVAEISAYNKGNIYLANDSQKGVAAYVGSNSILKISAPIKGATNTNTIQKYGEGTLYITGVQTDVSYVVSLGTLRTNVNLGQRVTINTGAVLEIEGGSDETTPLVFDMPTTNNGSSVIKSGFVKIAAGTEGTMNVASGATLMLQLTAQQVAGGYDASAITGTGTIMFVDESGNLINIIRKATTIGKFGTICLPYAATVSDAKVYTVSVNVESNTVVLTEFTGSILNGGTPYIYSSTAGAPTFTKSGTDALLVSPSNPESGLVGTFTSLPAPVGSYVLQTISDVQKFRVVADGQQPTVGAYRCYIKSTTNSAREMSIELGEATGIDALNAIVNNNAEVYDLAGRKMKGLQKGINIVNGAKIIVK